MSGDGWITEFRSVPCTDERCPTVLGGPTHSDLCVDCREQFEAAGVVTEDQQLELDPDEQAEAA